MVRAATSRNPVVTIDECECIEKEEFCDVLAYALVGGQPTSPES
ncbi:MAG: hypothetical protein QOJ08_275 [Ilumatobacteraceae bacterium]